LSDFFGSFDFVSAILSLVRLLFWVGLQDLGIDIWLLVVLLVVFVKLGFCFMFRIHFVPLIIMCVRLVNKLRRVWKSES
jgi:hypothetical protein